MSVIPWCPPWCELPTGELHESHGGHLMGRDAVVDGADVDVRLIQPPGQAPYLFVSVVPDDDPEAMQTLTLTMGQADALAAFVEELLVDEASEPSEDGTE